MTSYKELKVHYSTTQTPYCNARGPLHGPTVSYEITRVNCKICIAKYNQDKGKEYPREMCTKVEKSND